MRQRLGFDHVEVVEILGESTEEESLYSRIVHDYPLETLTEF